MILNKRPLFRFMSICVCLCSGSLFILVKWFDVGATLCKGLNRGLGTVLAGSLAFFIEFVANRSDHVFRAIFIGFAVFLIGK